MARPVSWFPRLPALAQTVADSVRSHYTTTDLERLFCIQPRSAQMLIRLLPTVQIGKSRLVEREALARFLVRLAEADDPAQELAEMRATGKPPTLRRKLRDLIQRDADVSALPESIIIEQGTLSIQFQTVEELAASLWRIAQLLDDDLEDFADRYEPQEVLEPASAEDVLELADATYIRTWMKQHTQQTATS